MIKKKTAIYIGSIALSLLAGVGIVVGSTVHQFLPTIADQISSVYCADLIFGTKAYIGNDVLDVGDWTESVEGNYGKINPGLKEVSGAYAETGSMMRLEANGSFTLTFPGKGVAIRGVRVIATVDTNPVTISLSSSAHPQALTTIIEKTGTPDISDQADQSLNYVTGLDNNTGAESTTITISTNGKVNIAKIVFTIVGDTSDAKSYSYVTFTEPNGNVTGSWIENGTTLSLSDAPSYGEGSNYYLYKDNDGQILNNHPLVTHSMNFKAEVVSSTNENSSLSTSYQENLTPGENPSLQNSVITKEGSYSISSSTVTVSAIDTSTGNTYTEVTSVDLSTQNGINYNGVSQRLFKNSEGKITAPQVPSPNGQASQVSPGDFTIALEDTERTNDENVSERTLNYKPTIGSTTIDTTRNGIGPTNYVSTRITLESDQYLSGSLVLGGITGYYGNIRKDSTDVFAMINHQGAIISSYSELDLAGHDLVVGSGASLISYGSITDSIGGGKIILLDGATFQSPLVIQNNIKEAAYAVSFINGTMPFLLYRMPYINADIDIHAGATVIGNMRAKLAGNGTDGINQNIVLVSANANGTLDTPEDDALIVLSKGVLTRSVSYDASLKSQMKAKYNTKLNANTAYNQSDIGYHNVEYQRISYEGNSITAALNHFSVHITSPKNARLDSNRAPFLVAPYFDIALHGDSNVTLNNQMTLLPGSSFVMDPDGTLNFSKTNTDELSNLLAISGKIEYQGVGGLVAVPTLDIPNTKSYMNSTTIKEFNGGDVLKKMDTFWNYMNAKSSTVHLPNNFSFGENPELNTPYIIGGNMNINSIEGLTSAMNSKKVSFTASNAFVVGNYKPVVFFNHAAVQNYYSIPLNLTTSDGKTYVPDANSTNLVSGSYDKNTGLMNVNGKNYIYLLSANEVPGFEFKPLLDGSWEEVTKYENHVATVNNGNQYIFFNGAHLEVASINSSTQVTANFERFNRSIAWIIGTSSSQLKENQSFTYNGQKWTLPSVEA